MELNSSALLPLLGGLIGGLGLFLLGMRLITEGLRLLASHNLRQSLERWTAGPLRGVTSGFAITAMVQSSSVVTFAIIGFINAGLISLYQAITLIYGSNLGTTVTGWLVSLIGFNVDIKAFALPLLGSGMVLSLVSRRYDRPRWRALGEAMAGFGLFFLGILFLKETFLSLHQGLPALAQPQTVGTQLGLLVLGFVLTVVMQSSSAAMAIILSAVAGGMLNLFAASLLIIGTNIGTTTTAMLAVIGASANAKRTAAAHIGFNLITALVALLILPLLLQLGDWSLNFLGLPYSTATHLAVFHTLFNLLGVLLFLPLTHQLVTFLDGRFHSEEEDRRRPRFLDKTLLATPALATHALTQELARIGGMAHGMARSAISSEGRDQQLQREKDAIDTLMVAVGEFSNQLQRGHLPSALDDMLPSALRVSRYYNEMAELSLTIEHAPVEVAEIHAEPLAEAIHQFKGEVIHLLALSNPEDEHYSPETVASELEQLQKHYQLLKSQLLRGGTQNHIAVRALVEHLDQLSNIRRLAEQAVKGSDYLQALSHIASETDTDTDGRQSPPS